MGETFTPAGVQKVINERDALRAENDSLRMALRGVCNLTLDHFAGYYERADVEAAIAAVAHLRTTDYSGRTEGSR